LEFILLFTFEVDMNFIIAVFRNSFSGVIIILLLNDQLELTVFFIIELTVFIIIVKNSFFYFEIIFILYIYFCYNNKSKISKILHIDPPYFQLILIEKFIRKS
jgi:hypothetical protein